MGGYYAKIKRYATPVVDFIWPPRCAVTGGFVAHQGDVAAEAWGRLRFIADPQCACCGFPFDFDTGEGAVRAPDVASGAERLCGSCARKAPPFKTARAALAYDDVSRDMVLRYKNADQLHLVRSFLPWLMRAGADQIEASDYIVPVPLHRWRLLKRRYNQSAELARSLAKVGGKPAMVHALKRIRATSVQGHLNYNQRKKNVRRAFIIRPQDAEKLAGRTVLLVDDVYTTGATAKECTRALLAAGVSAVHVLSVARVVRPDYAY